MPTYSYKCEKCEHTFDLFQRMSEDPIKDCPACEEESVKRLIGPGAGFIFKGSGFYITDYRSKEYNEKAKAEASPKESKTETSNGSSETSSSTKESSTSSSSGSSSSDSKQSA